MPSVAADVILASFPEASRRHRRARDLAAHVAAFTGAASLRARVDTLDRLCRWLMRPDPALPGPEPWVGSLSPRVRRLGALIAVLEKAPEVREAVRGALAALLAESSGLGLFAEVGLHNDRGLVHETSDRLFLRLLPAPRDDHELARLLLRLFPHKNELAWIESLSPDLFQRLAAALVGDGGVFAPLEEAAIDAIALLGARVQALGLSEEMRTRATPGPVQKSPFFRLARMGDQLLERLHEPGPRREIEGAWRDLAAGCRAEMQVVLAHLEEKGISVDVVYSLEVIEQAIARMERLFEVLMAPDGAEKLRAAHSMLLVLVRARLSDRSLRDLMRSNLKLLARKLIERAGKTGEHYIAHTRREYLALVLGAVGGGVITAGTASGKIGIAGAGFAPFVEGLASGALYAVSFILIQFFGFTLATKQPSMTAAHLAGAIGDLSGPNRIAELVAHTARICRSQLAAAMGNVGTVAAASLGLDLYWRWRTGGHAFLSDAKANYVLASLNPVTSGTIWYAFLTGIILWLSSLAGGWIENFSVYHRVPDGIAEHRLGRLLGARTMRALAGFFARNISGYGGGIALGLMLGMAPIFGKFFGLPLDVRHVTLSSGTLVLAAAAKGQSILTTSGFLWACAGIGVIFFFNLSTSFTLAVNVALRAREVPTADKVRLFGAIVSRMLRHPGEFTLPPRRGETAPAAHGHHAPAL